MKLYFSSDLQSYVNEKNWERKVTLDYNVLQTILVFNIGE